MSVKEIKALARRLYERWNKDKATALAVIDELCATDIVVHGGGGDEIRGIKDFKKSMGELFDAFPDLHITIDDMTAEGDKVVVRYTWTGTNKGAFKSTPPTSKKLTIWEIDIIRIAGGKIVESWARMDTLGMMQQLGLIPTPKK